MEHGRKRGNNSRKSTLLSVEVGMPTPNFETIVGDREHFPVHFISEVTIQQYITLTPVVCG